MNNIPLHQDGLLPHLSHSRMQKYITCPEQYRLHYLEGFRPRHEAGARVFGAVMHLALAEYFRKERDPLATFRAEWNACREFELRYSQRESWEKLSQIGEALLQKFLAQEAQKFEQVLAVEAEFHIGASNIAAPLVGTLDLLAVLQGKKTLVDFKTGANDWGEHDVLLSDQLIAYRLASRKLSGTLPSVGPSGRSNTCARWEWSSSRSLSACSTSGWDSGAASAISCHVFGTEGKGHRHAGKNSLTPTEHTLFCWALFFSNESCPAAQKALRIEDPGACLCTLGLQS
jgi:PD-(D/E)XK nuclease superfamily